MVHTETTRDWDFCAFTSKTRKFATMMHSIGYDVRLYAGEANEAEAESSTRFRGKALQNASRVRTMGKSRRN